jgi:cation transporter-like permease
VTVEHPSTASSKLETADHSAEDELQAEHGLARAIIIGVLVAVPISVAVFVGLVAFAVSRSGSPLGGPIAMAVPVGVLSGLFFGTWAAFVSKTHLFEEMDRNVDSGGPNPIRP